MPLDDAPHAAPMLGRRVDGRINEKRIPRGQRPPHPTLWRLLRALRPLAPDERPPGVPRLRYRFPPRWLFAMGRDMLRGRPRSFRADCALAVHLLPAPPVIEGLEHVPAHGSFVLVANHYQRRDLWIGWPGALLCHALWRVRDDLTCHFVATDRAVLDGATVPWTPWAFARVARVWDFILVTPPEALDTAGGGSRRHALGRCLRLLKRDDGRSACLALFPEGMNGSTRGLTAPAPGSGRSLLALAAAGAPLLPAAVWEDAGGALRVRFGAPWHLAAPTIQGTPDKRDLDAWAGDDALAHIAALLPERLRGGYG